MAYTTINKSTAHFNTKLYNGNGSTQSITGVGFQPDFTWIKNRQNSYNHALFDAVRGVTKFIASNNSNAEETNANELTAFGTDGFTSGNADRTNKNSDTFASWNWKAGGSGSANTAGSINSTVSVNTTAGFSIVKWTGNGTAGATVGHGLGVVPQMIMSKSTGHGENWAVYHHKSNSTPEDYYLALDTTSGASDSSVVWNDTAPSSTLITLGTQDKINKNGSTHIAYCFAGKQGYSKFGSYVGNGNADGAFVYTGFKPAFVLIKVTSTTNDWEIHDNKRGSSNVINAILQPNLNVAESTSGREIDFLSNGFKLRNGSSQNNNSGSTFIYMAFGQSIVGSNNVPATAR